MRTVRVGVEVWLRIPTGLMLGYYSLLEVPSYKAQCHPLNYLVSVSQKNKLFVNTVLKHWLNNVFIKTEITMIFWYTLTPTKILIMVKKLLHCSRYIFCNIELWKAFKQNISHKFTHLISWKLMIFWHMREMHDPSFGSSFCMNSRDLKCGSYCKRITQCFNSWISQWNWMKNWSFPICVLVSNNGEYFLLMITKHVAD